MVAVDDCAAACDASATTISSARREHAERRRDPVVTAAMGPPADAAAMLASCRHTAIHAKTFNLCHGATGSARVFALEVGWSMPSKTAGRGQPCGGGRVARHCASLADHLGLSPASVSLVLNRAPAAAGDSARRPRIASAPRRRRFGYRPNTLAKSLRRQRTLTIGVMVPEISEGYAALVMSGIEDALLQAGYLYFVASHRHRPTSIDEYPRLMLDRAVDGLIAVDTPLRSAAAGAGRRRLRATPRRRASPTSSSTTSARPRQALAHLRELGHRRIAYHQGAAVQLGHGGPLARRSARRRAAHGLAVDRAAGRRSSTASSPLPDLGYTRDAPAAGRDAALHGAVRLQRHLGARRDPRDPRSRAARAGGRVGRRLRRHRERGLPAPGADDGAPAALRDGAAGRRHAGGAPGGAREQGCPRTISLEPTLMVRGTTGPVRTRRQSGPTPSRTDPRARLHVTRSTS